MTTLGGYDCNFVDNPPDELVCQICTLVALHPYQTTCCGRVYCKRCVDDYKRQNHEIERKFHCPNCRKRTQTFHDKRGSRNIQCLRVKCTFVQLGCYWEGELHMLEEHVSQCGFCQIPCPNSCSIAVTRANLDTHVAKECPKRKYACPDCNKEGTYRSIVTEHMESCPEAIVPCPNGCGFVPIVRKLLGSHRLVCPNQPILCEYEQVGCVESVKRKDMPYHKTQCLEHHLDLAMKLTKKLQQPIAVYKLKEFASLKSNKKWWYSPGFLTNPGGYKLCLGVMASGNGDGVDTHVSVYVYRMRGEHDEQLVWPFRGWVTFDVLNHVKDEGHIRRTVPFEFHKENEFNSRVVKGERSAQGWGFNRLLSHENLVQSASLVYVKDDCMFFRVVSAEVCPSNKPWLIVTS